MPGVQQVQPRKEHQFPKYPHQSHPLEALEPEEAQEDPPVAVEVLVVEAVAADHPLSHLPELQEEEPAHLFPQEVQVHLEAEVDPQVHQVREPERNLPIFREQILH